MRVFYVLLVISCFVQPAFAQLYEDCDSRRLGALAEPKRFTYVNLTPGHFEISSKYAAAYTICGIRIEIPKGEIVDVGGDSYKGSYDGHNGIWREALIDFDGSGQQSSTRVYILSTDLEQVTHAPSHQLFNYKAYMYIDDSGHYGPVKAEYRATKMFTDSIFSNRIFAYLIFIGIFLLIIFIAWSIYKKLTAKLSMTASRTANASPHTDYSGIEARPIKVSNKQETRSSVVPPVKQELVIEAEPEDLNVIFSELDSLIGLESVKREVKSLANLMKVQKLKRDSGISTTVPNIHLVFTGSAGTGKTTVAQLIGRIYKQIGLLPKGHTVMVSREDLIGQYIGHTAPKTKAVIEKAAGGVLFIDEAYSLHVELHSTSDFGAEAISTLIQSMENHRGKFAVILAGYSKDMAEMLNSNQGLKSRLSNFIDFPDYSFDDLILIFQKTCNDREHIISDGVIPKVVAELKRSKEHYQENFGNAREVRTLIERIEKNQSNRLARIKNIEKMPEQIRIEILKTIMPEDVSDDTYEDNASKKRPIGF